MVQHFINSELFKSLLTLILVMNQKVKYKLVLLEYDCIDKTVNIFKLIKIFCFFSSRVMVWSSSAIF